MREDEVHFECGDPAVFLIKGMKKIGL